MTDAQSLNVTEIFYSIQGESLFAGYPCAFVRLSGCPLRCKWCDTLHAQEESQDSKKMTFSEVLSTLRTFNSKLVEVTGGEPLAQQMTIPFLKLLINTGYRVLLETNGAEDIAFVPIEVHVVMDIKCPSSGMHERMNLANIVQLKRTDEIKFVIGSHDDFTYAVKLIKKHSLQERCSLVFSPVSSGLPLEELASLLLRSGVYARLQVQLHKVIWGSDCRGV